ncbi:MAG: hypothetical protein NTW21_34450 [Verrucomicrobia bacterium]|nr:hypothetical protein [Verrucomicrobiota bacterium]
MQYRLTGLVPSQRPKPVTTPHQPPPSATSPATTPAAIDLAKLTPAQLPAQVTLKIATEVADASGLKLKVDAGNRLKLVRLEGDQVVVSPGTSPFEGRVPVSGTDLMEQLAANPPPPNATTTDPTPTPAPEPATPTPAPEPTAPTGQPDPFSSGGTRDPVAVTPPPVPEPVMPEPPASAPASGVTGDSVEVMKAHIRSGGIKEFTFQQVLGWKAEADEVINGETYQTGLVRYKAETIFGVKTIEAKALIQNGKVVRWVWPKSGMEIK